MPTSSGSRIFIQTAWRIDISFLSPCFRNKGEAAYARSDLFERRRILMDD